MMRDRINTLKGLIGGNPQGMLNQLASSNMMCVLPNGTHVRAADVIAQCQGKTPAEAFAQFGLDFSQFQSLM